MKTLIWNQLSNLEKAKALARPQSANDISEKVAAITDAVRAEGDQALLNFTKEFDQVNLSTLQVSADEFVQAQKNIAPELLAAINFALKQIEAYHNAQMPKASSIETTPGIVCERQARPIDAVGLYIPGGSAPLISTVLMLGVPARLAGCATKVLCTPANKNGLVDPAILVAAQLCGIDQVFKVGGAQAIAAMAYGTASIPKVLKIFGPGNAWVTAAKVLVAQDPQGALIDMPAGPSELMVIADENANPEYIAADLLSQAEHGPDSQVLLVSTSSTQIDKVKAAVIAQTQGALRQSIIEQSLAHARFIEVASIDTALDIANSYAPEHLILQVTEPSGYIAKIKNAGAVFLGPWSAETMGDYITGSNHVLPTHGYARSISGLSLLDFMKFISFQTVSRKGLEVAGPYAEIIAAQEGLMAHKNAVSIRLKDNSYE